MRAKVIFILLIILFQSCKNVDYAKNKNIYLEEQLEFATPVWKYINGNKYYLNTLNQNDFTQKVDSIQTIFTNHLKINNDNLDRVLLMKKRHLLSLHSTN